LKLSLLISLLERSEKDSALQSRNSAEKDSVLQSRNSAEKDFVLPKRNSGGAILILDDKLICPIL
jgi:hypothetical protein